MVLKTNGRKRSKISFFRFCTRSRGRTGTALRPLVFETSASTNSAIRAFLSVDFQKYFKSTFCQIVLYAGWRNWPSLQPGPSLNCSTGAILYGRSCHPGNFICRLTSTNNCTKRTYPFNRKSDLTKSTNWVCEDNIISDL